MTEVTRRQFVASVIVAGGALTLSQSLALAADQPAAPAAPADETIIWANMGKVDSFAKGTWVNAPYPATFGKKKAFVRVADGKTVTALSPKCPHNGCPVTFDDSKKQFLCPCHTALFSDTGAVISGPSPTALVSLKAKIEADSVWVQSLTPPKPAAP
ncbi:MAG TPA: Rieske (2Fe-2S) protein [Capsulimonadaceae bacterium]|jgi:Rieske Fe-S protein